MNDFESRLRASLRRHAQDAPDGDRLAERILRDTSAGTAPSRRRREWRTWTFPLAAAGAVAAIAGALVGVNQVHHHSATPAGPMSTAPSVLASPVPTNAPSSLPTLTTTAPPSQPTLPPTLRGVRVLDATFVGPDDGWLLASADCLNGKPGKCTAMLRTTDGGRRWTSMPNPGVNVPGVKGCANPCVDHIRFATAKAGYAYGDGYYGSGAFLITTDGGKSWQPQQQADVVALETLDNNVIRVTTTQPGCGPPGCTYQVQTAAIGSTQWTTHALTPPAEGATTGAQLVRSGSDAYVLVTMNWAGGANNATSVLYRSGDDGASWQRVGEPCPQRSGANGEVDSTAIAAGGQGRVSVLCVGRMPGTGSFVAVSTDAGAHFAATPGGVPRSAIELLVGDPQTVLLAAGGSHVYRSADGGASWQAVAGPTGKVSWIGFESTTVGRLVAANGSTIWTTQDGGEHWTALPLG